MRKSEIGHIVGILLKYYEGKTIDDRVNFMSFLEGLCDSESMTYILWDLNTLATSLREQNAIYLIDEIAKYDYKAAQQLDMLVQTVC
jgi:hypothetical protein